VLLDEEAAALLDAEAGETSEKPRILQRNGQRRMAGWRLAAESAGTVYGDSGGRSRFFYTAKAGAAERSAGLPVGERSDHPTVKPLDLMRWLTTLVAPPDGLVLDPFLGSGTTAAACAALGRRCVGIEMDERYCEIAAARVRHWAGPLFVATRDGEQP
jgi:site-specific DNA-methyltransferase (adenine-specific)